MWVDVFFKNEGLRENYSLRAASEPCRKEVYESRSMAEDDKLINILQLLFSGGMSLTRSMEATT